MKVSTDQTLAEDRKDHTPLVVFECSYCKHKQLFAQDQRTDKKIVMLDD
jgi:hypothetical protein